MSNKIDKLIVIVNYVFIKIYMSNDMNKTNIINYVLKYSSKL
jgi:hypothetical protein